ncbi:ATPAse vacuolar Er assembly factor vma12 [Neofusicoccum parvum]|uniref:ATPAse vacuolar Er assembly factor vma12 n=2 Tax=Neofusicoccum parvum TaxID=310453 RepID=A0ACB5SBL0_9PEZI|nr:putative vacuolar h+-atpase assembly protein [Neofusicoccum parvum UCRNP2]GME34020.1 ATPAse vacuolar Er assembly factor vma12 [Neofusicoccum parvum]GME39863.1 ATPAse vacuolar Er assembly factor vma12 [Neofusicoccum parvum]
MVLLTMTPAIAAAVARCETLASSEQMQKLQPDGEPQLSDPAPGRPVSHAQLIDISDFLKARADHRSADDDEAAEAAPTALNDLLRGSRIYTPPPKPKPEPSTEYKQLMARLRREEEARAYERMLNPPAPAESFSQRFPTSNAHLFSAAGMDHFANTDEDDEVTYADINRQLALIINVLVSIIACSCAIWIAARYWIAEVAIYMGYLRRIKEARVEEKKKPEIKEIAETWVIEGGNEKKSTAIHKTSVVSDEAENVRHRKGKQK